LTADAHILYKVVEVAPVTEESVERALNDRVREGWGFESIHFVMREGSHRPAMAYLFFTRVREDRELAPSVGATVTHA
jgi:hypothetical protein